MLIAIWNVLAQLSPWLFVGMLFAGLLHVLVPEGLIRRRLRGSSGVVQAVALGVPLPLCSCGVVPAGIGLKEDGASDGASLGFLISTPQTGIDSIFVSASFLGWPFAIFKLISATVMGIAGGLLAERYGPRDETAPLTPKKSARESHGRGMRAMAAHGLEIVRSIWPWLVFGVVVSAAIDTYLPHQYLTEVASMGIVASSFAALAISLPLYVCAIASVPIAASLVNAGLPAGAALVFLMAGPATNVATMGAIYRRFGTRMLSIYLGTIVVGSVGFAAVFDWLIVASVDGAGPMHHDHTTWWAQAFAAIMLVLLAWFALDACRRRWNQTVKNNAATGAVLKMSVKGMTCNACASRLEKALQRTEGVESAAVQFEPGEAVVRGSIDENQLRKVIRESGFTPNDSEAA